MSREWREENIRDDLIYEVANETRPYTDMNADELAAALEYWEDKDLERVGIYRASSHIQHYDWQGRRGRLKAYTVRRPVVVWQEVEVYDFDMGGALESASMGLKDHSGQTMCGGMHIVESDWETTARPAVDESGTEWEVELSKNQEF